MGKMAKIKRESFGVLCGLGLAMWSPQPMADTSSTQPSQSSSVMEDPLESWNRFIFELNNALDTLIFFPVLDVYSAFMPKPLQTGVENVVENLWEPLRSVNFLFQGDPEKATISLCRFLVNATFGLLGLVDVAEEMGVSREETDFGRTLQGWGAEPGCYVVWPLLGPGSVRDGLGLAIDTAIDPINLLCSWKKKTGWMMARTGAEFGVKKHAHMDSWKTLQETSVDFYAAVRSLYGQNRNKSVVQGKDAFADDDDAVPSSPGKPGESKP